MTFTTETCVVVSCDLCGYTLDQDETVQHYSTEAAAVTSAVHQGWTQLLDDRVVCNDDDHLPVIAEDVAARFEAAAS